MPSLYIIIIGNHRFWQIGPENIGDIKSHRSLIFQYGFLYTGCNTPLWIRNHKTILAAGTKIAIQLCGPSFLESKTIVCPNIEGRLAVVKGCTSKFTIKMIII